MKPSGSFRASRSTGIAGFAASRISPSAVSDSWRTLGQRSSFADFIRTGTASFAHFGPMFPSAAAAAVRTSLSRSVCRSTIRRGTAGRAASFL